MFVTRVGSGIGSAAALALHLRCGAAVALRRHSQYLGQRAYHVFVNRLDTNMNGAE
jgi:hypothetical protein